MKASLKIDGAGRGGKEYCNLITRKLAATDHQHLITVDLSDPAADRAEEVAVRCRKGGLTATAHREFAPIKSDATIRTLAMDHAPAFNRIVAEPITNDVLEMGFLTATPTFGSLGGSVIGLGATLTPNAPAIYEHANVITNQFSGMAPERLTSRNISVPALNSIQAADTRHQVHDRLTASSWNYLNNCEVEAELFAVDGLTRNAYPLDVVETRRNMLRAELVEVATHDIMPPMESGNRHGGVVFFDQRALWLYFVLCHKIDTRWSVEHAIEFPAVALQPVVIPQIGEIPQPRARTTFLDPFVTD